MSLLQPHYIIRIQLKNQNSKLISSAPAIKVEYPFCQCQDSLIIYLTVFKLMTQ